MKMDGIRFLRVSCPSILTALKIEGDRFSIHSTAMTEDSFSVMLIITLICLFTRYEVVKIQSLSSHNNAASFTKGLNNLGADEGSTFCDLVIRYHLVKKLSSDENVRNEKKVPNQLESTKIRRKCPKSDESVRKQTRASEIGRKLSKTDGKVRNRKERTHAKPFELYRTKASGIGYSAVRNQNDMSHLFTLVFCRCCYYFLSNLFYGFSGGFLINFTGKKLFLSP